MMADGDSDFSFDDVVAQLDDLNEDEPKKSVEAVPPENISEEVSDAGAVVNAAPETVEKKDSGVEPSASPDVVEAIPASAPEQPVEEFSVPESEKTEFVDSAAPVAVLEPVSVPPVEPLDEASDDEADSAGEDEAVIAEQTESAGEFEDADSHVDASGGAGGLEADEENLSEDSSSADSENIAADFNPLDPASVGKFLEDMGVPPDIVESKKCLIDVMQRENELLDKILETQTELHNFVREKNWESLNEKLSALQDLSDTFAALEEERETLCELIDMRTDSDFSPVLTEVRGKLQRSKIENNALNEYISTTRKFLQGVFDSVVPQRRNVLYSKNGKIVRPELSGVAVNISL